jgi:hypothetical protein
MARRAGRALSPNLKIPCFTCQCDDDNVRAHTSWSRILLLVYWLLLSALLQLLKHPTRMMTSLPAINEDDMSYGSDSSFEEQECKRRRAGKVVLLAATMLFAENRRKAKARGRRRSANRKRNRKTPEEILAEGVCDGHLKDEYRMSKESLLKLHSLVKPFLEARITRRLRGDAIPSLVRVMMTLRYLAGSRWVDIVRIHGVSKSSLFLCIRQVTRAIVRHPLIGKPKFPTDEVEAKEYADEWASLSGPPAGRRGVLSGCIGAIDGILIKTRAPTNNETVRVTDFYSGHKCTVGLNVQVVCDARKRIIFLSVLCPGKTNDLVAYESSKVASLIEGLPAGYYALGDNAYVNSNHLLVPFPGKLCNTDPRDAFNFYLSQLRVRVENCFALLVGRWGIFWGRLRMPLRYQPIIIKATCCLHNFCIDEGDVNPCKPPRRTENSDEVAATDEDGRLIDPSWNTMYGFQRSVAFDSLRDDLVSFIASEGLVRPPI